MMLLILCIYILIHIHSISQYYMSIIIYIILYYLNVYVKNIILNTHNVIYYTYMSIYALVYIYNTIYLLYNTKISILIDDIEEYEKLNNCRLVYICDHYKQSSIYNTYMVEIDDNNKFVSIINDIINTNKELHIIIEASGGSVISNNEMLHALNMCKNVKKAFIPLYAMSAATLLTLACDYIYMHELAYLTATDPQFTINNEEYSAFDIKQIYKKRREECVEIVNIKIEYNNVCIEDKYNIEITNNLLKKHSIHKNYKKLLDRFTSGKFNHYLPINKCTLKEHLHIYDLNKSNEIYKLYLYMKQYK